MKQKIINIINKLEKSYLDYLNFIIKLVFWVAILFFVLPFLAKLFTSFFKINIQLSDFILLITAAFIIAYTYETQKMKEQAIKQTELDQMPVMVLYIRNIDDYSKDKRETQKEYCIKTGISDLAEKFDTYGGSNIKIANEFNKYILRIRNTGKGPAFNLKVESKDFKVEKYQSQFFAPEPKGDEQSIKITRISGEEIKNYSKFKNVIFEITCENIDKKEYKFRYKIIDIENRQVEFLGKG